MLVEKVILSITVVFRPVMLLPPQEALVEFLGCFSGNNH